MNKSEGEFKNKKAGSIAFENARPDMISEKSILFKNEGWADGKPFKTLGTG